MATREDIIDSLDQIQDNLNDITRPSELLNLMNSRQLHSILSSTDVPVDADIVTRFGAVATRLSAPIGTPGSFAGEIENEITNINADITRIEGDITNLETEITGLRAALWTGTTAQQINIRLTQQNALRQQLQPLRDRRSVLERIERARVRRATEYTTLSTMASSFNIGGALTNVDIDLANRAASTTPTMNADSAFNTTPGVGVTNFTYTLCARDTTPLRSAGANRYIYNHNGTDITLSNVIFNAATGVFDFTNVDVNPAIDVAALNFSVRANRSAGGFNFFLDKPFTINFRNYSLNTPADRQPVLCNYNTVGGGVLQNILHLTYDRDHETMEREALFSVLRRNDPSNKLDSLTPDQQQEAYRVLRQLYTPLGWNIGRAAMVNYAGANSFEEWFTANNHPGSRLPHNRNATTYRDYIHANHPQEIQRYMRERFENVFSDYANSTFLKANFLDFLNALQERQQDTDVDRTLDARPLPQMQNARRFTMFGRDVFGRRDVNYLRFFAGANTSVDNVSLTLHRNGTPETIDYNMNLQVESAQRMSVTIDANNITGGAPLTLTAGDPAALIRKVLRNTNIPYGKQRVHIAYNIVRSLITLAQGKNIPLQYLVPGTNNQINRLEMQGNNVVLANSDVNVATRRDTVTTLFDYDQHFGASQNWENGGTSLEYGIYSMMNHFGHAMEQTHQQYRNAVTSRVLGAGDKLHTNVSLSRWKNPIKSLLNVRNRRNFDFDVHETVNGRQVAIGFRNNRFSIQLEGYDKPFEGSLNTILRTRERGRRVFDGMELEILSLVNRNLLTLMRQNTKIENSLVASRDPLTGRLYFIEPTIDGSLIFSFVDAYDTRHVGLNAYDYDQEMARARTGKQVTNAVGAGVLGAGAGVLGVGAVAAGATVGGIAQGVGAVAAGGGLFNRVRRVFQRRSGTISASTTRLQNYGIIHREDNVAAGRQNCRPNEIEAVLRNPVVMGRFYKAMQDRMGGYESFRAFWSNVA